MSSFIENLKAVTDNTGDIVFTQFAIVTEVNEDGTVSCKEKETGTVHKNVINSTVYELDIDDNIIIGFANNSVYDVFVVGAIGADSAIDLSEYAKKSYVAENYSEKTHDHDSRYYTENEIDTLLSGKSDTDHVHDDRYYDKETVDEKISQHDGNFYSKSQTDDLLDLKVDKVAGKNLSTNDYTDTDKNKLAGIEEGANNYVHPATHASSMITGLTANKDVVTDSNGLLATVDKEFNYEISCNTYNLKVGDTVTVYIDVFDGNDPVAGHTFDLWINNDQNVSLTTNAQGYAACNVVCSNEGLLKFNVKTSIMLVYVKKDTGWVAVSDYKSGYSHYTESDNLVVRRTGDTVELRGYWKTSADKAGSTSATVFATLPSEYKPDRLVYSVQRTPNMNTYYLLVNASGELAWSHYGNTSTATLSAGTRMYTFMTWTV